MENIVILIGSLLGVFFVLSIVLGVRVLKLKKKIKGLAVAYSQLDGLLSTKKQDEPANEVHQENFIKFLSDSRDWAFEYIEEVQTGLTKFMEKVDGPLSYFDEYGDVVSTNRPDYKSLKTISTAYKELKKLMPDDEDTK